MTLNRYKVYYYINDEWCFSNSFDSKDKADRHAECFRDTYHVIIYDAVNGVLTCNMKKDISAYYHMLSLFQFYPVENQS